MPISPARVAAYEILLRAETTQAYASELLHSTRYSKLSSGDHGLATEIVLGVLRWRSLLDHHIAQHSSLKLEKLDVEVLTALRIGAYQLLFLERIPKRAAVHESVELVKRAQKRSAVAFANAVLRKLGGRTQGETIQGSRTDAELALSGAHPQWLVERWIQAFGLATARKICSYDQAIPETFVTILDDSVEAVLKDERIELAAGDWLRSACRVVSGDPTRTKAFRAGKSAIQDEGSQLVAVLVGDGGLILDCCAAPGGKTRILAERNPRARIVAAELHPHRARLLRQRVPAENVSVVAADVRSLPTSALFDRVLVDVPCSGTGTLARNPEIKWRLRPDDLGDLQLRQIDILRSAMQRVASGGRLVYSTCSLEREENEDVIQAATSTEKSFVIVDCKDRLKELQEAGELISKDIESLTRGPYLRTIPGVHHCDGFFAAILARR